MPLHDWTDLPEWERMHINWLTEIARGLRADLPPVYRAVIGSRPLVAFGPELGKLDVPGTKGKAASHHPPATPPTTPPAPDVEVAGAPREKGISVRVECDGQLVAVVELVSPRNKDGMAICYQYGTHYLGYLHAGVHIVLIDIHNRPLGFSFPQLIAVALMQESPAPPAPSVVSYRVGPTNAKGKRALGVWQHVFVRGEPLPRVPLALLLNDSVMIDLDATYRRAAADCYLG